MTGRFISTHSVYLSLPLNIERLPDRGASVRAHTSTSCPGGGYTILSAVAELGVQAMTASPLGTGPNSFTVRQQLIDAGVEILSEELVGDIGASIALVEADGWTTSVYAAGVEGEPSLAALEAIELRAGDLIHIAGIDLVTETGARVLSQWAGDLPEYVSLVVSVSPAVDQVPVWAWKRLLNRADLLTMNIREAAALGRALTGEDEIHTLRDAMREDSAIVRRLGVLGCEYQLDAENPRIQIPAFDSKTVDTTGVGDTHIAAMCAELIQGADLEYACRVANAAAALTIVHEGAAPSPTRTQIDEVMRVGKVTESTDNI